MPIYVYECTHCSAEVEELQKMTDPPPVFCENCQSRGTLKRKMAASNFSLKEGGVGWAKNGYSG